MFTIGLTGGIGSGKSEVSKRFENLGITVIDTDIVAREVVEPGQSALKKIEAHFGPNILEATGELSRARLRKIIFSNPEEKCWLEELLHPIILKNSQNQLEQAPSDYAILVSPLLIESRQSKGVDRILVVDVSKEIQIQRTTARDKNTEPQVQAIIDSQLDREERLNHADDIIINDGDLNKLDEQIKELHQLYCKLAHST